MNVDPTVQIGDEVEIGQCVIIEENVKIGKGVKIGHHCVIKKDTIIQDHVRIEDLSILGKLPSSNKKMARKPEAHLAPLIIGSHTLIGAQVTLYRGSEIGNHAFIADQSSIREQVKIGQQTIVGRQVIIEPNTTIGEKTTIQTGSYITADTVIEEHVFIGPCCSMSNDKYMASGKGKHTGPRIRKGAKLGNHATLLPNIEIGEEAVVGAGAVVTKDVASRSTVVGNPAKLLKREP
ncbi:UDP-3-O-(3-hydroxymyristoyl) glucosamine N-acyltransferase [Alkalihalobacillus alcalophilus ATCC 27647 = CGMCC 1.3604]|uniref:UDP-3-O-(3-hydroxymyristoyl) glucosamine N-acyltransferase n=1 Tax=Alkalihalobacillus alcalophilus ATCC 27647 = CGMCC 1.3604 TaxID=1218173 RepID=A0A094WHP1_ALKAL|nr:N-acetyltransferase [Alkalihalobacillus alcalophilus]KGA97304.1 UDP-3-O-(3-hydroxymyristoyl) glucosamine N-acyltransferase [Alkalihalobacillus alcalophilus ATCC 27647 = CGMCC 1.3604]MED1562519.1 DapH/DapD/GlmU-related protein [Alkalihalobacillus alcalophilus]THG92142.1 UDP-3-O-(3-hydroxymyristoyl) glucosamine N-acyltransferase [Alkalihalobacillus alcalophilus ATCC 27647 = CGMCC 1.3604]